MVRRAYARVEKLIVPQHVNDTDDVYPTRTELGALVRLVNEELQRRIETAEVTLQSLRAAVGDAWRVVTEVAIFENVGAVRPTSGPPRMREQLHGGFA